MNPKSALRALKPFYSCSSASLQWQELPVSRHKSSSAGSRGQEKDQNLDQLWCSQSNGWFPILQKPIVQRNISRLNFLHGNQIDVVRWCDHICFAMGQLSCAKICPRSVVDCMLGTGYRRVAANRLDDLVARWQRIERPYQNGWSARRTWWSKPNRMRNIDGIKPVDPTSDGYDACVRPKSHLGVVEGGPKSKSL